MTQINYNVRSQFGQFLLNNIAASGIVLTSGQNILFDQSDLSNEGRRLKISTTADGIHNGGAEYTSGVTKVGTPGQSGAYTKFEPTDQNIYYYYGDDYTNMGSTIGYYVTDFIDPGVTAFDAEDGDITSSITKKIYKNETLLTTITGQHSNPWTVSDIDIGQTGNYKIVYDVIDASGVSALSLQKNISISAASFEPEPATSAFSVGDVVNWQPPVGHSRYDASNPSNTFEAHLETDNGDGTWIILYDCNNNYPTDCYIENNADEDDFS